MVYDHPTDLDEGFETLSRCLDSLKILRDQDFEVLVLGVSTNPRIEREVEKRVNEIVANYQKDLDVTVFSSSDLKRLHNRLDLLGYSNFIPYINLRGYGNVRNICLLVPHLLRSDVVVLLDDDEIVTDEDFLRKVMELVGKEFGGKIVGGITGYYVDKNGDYGLAEDDVWWKVLWNKERQMNRAFKIVESPFRFNATTFALGGCMIIHRTLLENVPFDPWITRGEDVDYLVNAKVFGFEFLLDNQLCVTHAPPETKGQFWQNFKQDVYRFLYQREKLAYMIDRLKLKNFTVDSLDPYPGHFLKSDLEARIIITGFLYLIHQSYAKLAELKDTASLNQVLREVELLLNGAKEYAQKHAAGYLSFREAWVDFMRETGNKQFFSLKE